MSPNTVFATFVYLSVLLALVGCSAMPGPTETSAETTPITGQPLPTEAAPAPSANPAVIALLDTARTDTIAGQLHNATANIERALRIEPRNPVLWHELAKIKWQGGEYQQAEHFAARANSWAGDNTLLQAQNWRLISEARAARGDSQGARAALARAHILEAAGQ